LGNTEERQSWNGGSLKVRWDLYINLTKTVMSHRKVDKSHPKVDNLVELVAPQLLVQLILLVKPYSRAVHIPAIVSWLIVLGRYA